MTDGGSVRVVDAMTLPDRRLEAMREIVRSVEGLVGHRADALAVRARFHYGAGAPRCEWRGGIPVATSGGESRGGDELGGRHTGVGRSCGPRGVRDPRRRARHRSR